MCVWNWGLCVVLCYTLAEGRVVRLNSAVVVVVLVPACRMPGFNMSRRRRVLWATDVMIWLLSFSLALNKGCV